ncbi:MAG: AEC family transporter [Ruminococcaceae bacterium]|nr:AEC family transporter [Oscillospiraceae bacterium]
MNSFVFALNATMPIVLTVTLGYVIKKTGLMNVSVAKSVNAIVFKLLLPAMLFLNVYNIADIGSVNLNYVWYVLIITFLLFLGFIPVVNLLFPQKNQRGVILQSIFRSNYALIGIPLATSLFAAEGAAMASLLAAFIIPVFNILGVICLCIYSEDEKPNIKTILLNIAKNPLIIGVCSGLVVIAFRALFVKLDIGFRLSEVEILFDVLKSLSGAATPMALLALGAQFEFSAIPTLKKQIIFGITLRSVIIPVSTLTVAYLLGSFNGANFATFVAMFSTPVAVSTVPMCQSMGADHTLAGQLVVWTTLISSVVIFLSSFILKLVGVF